MIQIKIGKLTVEGSNRKELLGIKKEIFDESIYYVDFDKEDPVILDVGAHVGLATIYFKRQWPRATVIAVEPYPENLNYLKQNLWVNKIEDVEVIEAAVAEQEGKREFFADKSYDQWYSTASFLKGSWTGEEATAAITVPTITLDSLLDRPIDLLKMDIEGAEEQVLRATKNLHLVKNLIIEIHPKTKPKSHPIQALLEKQYFQTEVAHSGFGLYRLRASKRK